MTFEANHGQTNPQVKFLSRGKGYTAFLTANGIVLSLHADQPFPAQASSSVTASSKSGQAANTKLQFKLVGATANPAVVGEELQPGRVNYFIGNDSTKWQRNVPTYGRVRYKNVYPGIDLLYYGNHQQLEYDFAISAGADPGQIQFEIGGANQIELDTAGNLVLQTNSGELHFQTPAIYQESQGQRVPLPGAYVMNDATHIAFHVAQYDSSKPLVIDPVLVYSTYLGGSGDDQPEGIAVDSTGSAYVTGYTDSTDFPLANPGSVPAGSTHVFIAKLDATGSNLVYADYLGGNGYDYGFALVLGSSNEVYLTGSTTSSNFPTVNPYQGTYPGSYNVFLTKVSADGSSLLYSTYLGGSGSDQPASIALDSSNDMFVAGTTTSTNFPTANAYQSTVSTNQGGMAGNYGFLTKFSPDGSSLVYSTYLAGNTNVALNCGGTPCWPQPYSGINGIAIDSTGNAYAGGITNTYNFPTTTGAYQTTDSTPQQNPIVGFVSKFSGAGSLDYSTYFYESSGSLTNINAIAVDSSGSAYVTGVALSDGTFPVTSTSICDPSVSGYNCSYAYITKFDPTGATLLYSTFLGVNNGANPAAIVLDASNDAYVASSTPNSSFNIVNGIEAYTNGSDLLIAEIDPLATTEIFATYFGGSTDEYPAGMALDSSGSIYVTGSTDSTDLPLTQGSFQNNLGGGTDAFLVKIGTSSAAAVALSPNLLQFASQAVSTSSQAQTTLLRNMGSASLAISSITASGDFAETDNCGASVPAAANCTLSVTFTPTTAGTRTGSILIVDAAAGSPHVINLSGVGSGAIASLAPTSLTFSAQQVGNSSAAQAVSLTNTGNVAMSIGTVQTTGDFAETNNCSFTLAASASCAINVTFTPTASGVRSGSLTISNNAQASPQSVNLTGTGSATPLAIAVVSPTSLAFTGQQVGTSSTTQSVSLTNTGALTLNVGTLQVSGDFAQVNNCPATLAANASCTINVTFTPTVSGSRSGSLTITDSALTSSQTVSLSGSGSDFSLASSPGSDTIDSGAAASYKLTVSPVGGSFANAVKLTCSGLPAQASCGFSPSTVTPGANAASATLSITTGASATAALPVHSSHSGSLFAIWMPLQGLGLFGMILAAPRCDKRKLRVLAVLALLVVVLIAMTGCAGGTGIAPPNQNQNQTQTTAGTYTVTVTGASGSLQHSMHLTLVVQ
ncbi:MAG: choice-of-anchor D domain-containing protein [Candidatus Sulfotelmatobacter sp.]